MCAQRSIPTSQAVGEAVQALEDITKRSVIPPGLTAADQERLRTVAANLRTVGEALRLAAKDQSLDPMVEVLPVSPLPPPTFDILPDECVPQPPQFPP